MVCINSRIFWYLSSPEIWCCLRVSEEKQLAQLICICTHCIWIIGVGSQGETTGPYFKCRDCCEYSRQILKGWKICSLEIDQNLDRVASAIKELHLPAQCQCLVAQEGSHNLLQCHSGINWSRHLAEQYLCSTSHPAMKHSCFLHSTQAAEPDLAVHKCPWSEE